MSSFSSTTCLRRLAIAVAIASALLAPSNALALDPARSVSQYVRTTWEDRLPHNTVRALLQSRDGFIYAGTYEGLVRFDGAEFTVLNSRNTAMRSSAVSALTEDTSGNLWIGTVGSGVYRYDGSRMTPFPLGALGVIVSALGSAPDGAVWIATRKGLGRIRDGKLEVFGADSGMPGQLIWAICAVSADEVWVGTEGGGLAHYRDGRFEVLTTRDGLSTDVVYSIARGPGGTMLVGTSGGVNRITGRRIEPAFPRGSILDGSSAFALLTDRDGVLWISGGKRGICRWNGTSISCESVDDSGTDLIRTFAEDREGNLWVGGTHRGLSQLRNGKLITTTGEASTNHVRTVTEDAAGRMWVGTDGSGVNLIRDGRLEAIAQNSALPSLFVRSVMAQRDGTLWVGTIEGLARIAVDGNVTIYRKKDGLGSDIVYSMMRARDDSVWIGTSAGINRASPKGFETIPFTGDVRALHEDRSGRIWIGQRDALSCLEQGKITGCAAPEKLRSATIFSFYEDASGAIWIGTNRGLARFRAGKYDLYATAQGLFDDNVFQILEDAFGKLWMSSNRGIWSVPLADFTAFDRKELKALRSKSYGKSDGMGSAQCNGASQPAGWKSRDGRLWFPTVAGVVSVEPSRITTNPFAPPVRVVKLMVDSKIADQTWRASIPSDAQHFEFHYAGLSFVAPEMVRFRYKLEGYDRNWIDAGTRRVAYYTNVPPGRLEFRVMASNSDGVWSREAATMSMFVEPRYYETWWFRVVAAMAFLAILFGIYRLRVRQLEARERQLVTIVDERTEALKAANAALQRLAAVDGLTRIPNRRAFDERLAAAWSEHQRREAPLSLILCDVDHFKNFNDARGHIAGDEALVSVATALERTLRRASDFAARYGGEEFVVLLADTESASAAMLAEQLIKAVRDLRIDRGDNVVTLSAGVATLVPTSELTPEHLVQMADDALYEAKRSGRNRVSVSSAKADRDLAS